MVSLGPDLCEFEWANEDLVGRVLLRSQLPRVTGGHGHHPGQGATHCRVAERQGGDARGELGELADALLRVAVPHIDQSVAAARGERVVGGVERDAVHGEHRLRARPRGAVALERVLPRLHLRARVEELHSHAALRARHHELLPVRVPLHVARLVLQTGLMTLLHCQRARAHDHHLPARSFGQRHVQREHLRDTSTDAAQPPLLHLPVPATRWHRTRLGTTLTDGAVVRTE